MIDHAFQNLKSKSIASSHIETVNIFHIFNTSLKKITEADVEQLKIYLGLAYFVLVTLISITLF